MHVIGFSHHYEKLHGQTWGTLVSVRNTAVYRPDDRGIIYDTIYENPLYRKWQNGEFKPVNAREWIEQWLSFPIQPHDFDKPLLQLVFVGGEHQIPFTTYRKIPIDYKPFWPKRFSEGDLPYSDLVKDDFVFKFKGEPLAERLKRHIGVFTNHHEKLSHMEIYE